MKYHPLSTKHLETNVEIFKAYLASEGIDAPLWSDIKKFDTQRLASIISNFSNVFFESLAESFAYFKIIEGNILTIIHFRDIDYEVLSFIPDESISGEIEHSEVKGEILYTTKKYKKDRKITISLYYHTGYRPCEKTEFNRLALLYAENQST